MQYTPGLAHIASSTAISAADVQLPLLAAFGTSWCSASQLLTQRIDGLAHEFRGRIAISHIDIEASPVLADIYDISAYPTVVFLHAGHLRCRLIGVQTQSRLRSWLAALLELSEESTHSSSSPTPCTSTYG